MAGQYTMGKRFYHARHFAHSLKKRSPRRYARVAGPIRDGSLRIASHSRPADPQLAKYWRFRRNLFSLIDGGGIHMTHELWFSVTPEEIAAFLARFVRACLPEARVVLDVFCGGGGNTIQFAKLFPRVYGVDFSLEHLYCTAQNAAVYGVDDKVWLKYGRWEQLSRGGAFDAVSVDCIFASPPWGGPNYLNLEVYDLEQHLQPVGITSLLKSMFRLSKNVILFLPRNSDLKQLARVTRELLGPEAKCKVLYVKVNAHLKGIAAIWGDALVNYESAPEQPEATPAEESESHPSNRDIPASFYDIDA